MSVNAKMTTLADEIRELSGTTVAMGLDAMTTHIGEANDEVNSQAELIAQIVSALDGKAAGIELPTLTNEGSASDLLSGKQLINGDGNKVTGTFSIDSELSTQDDLIAQIQAAVDSLPEVGGKEPTLQSKTVTPSTSSQTVTADSGYDGLDTVTVNAIPNTYVKPTSTKAATTYTPTTSNQTIAAGTYCSGIQTIKGDANLVPANIVSGKSIFGVVGTYSGGSSGGSSSIETCTVQISLDGPPLMPTYYYTDENFNVKSITTDAGLLVVPKNTIVAISGWSASSAASGCTQLFYMMGFAAYQITGNTQFTFMP